MFDIEVKVDIKDWATVTRDKVREMAGELREAGRQNISTGGRFGGAWQRWLRTSVRQEGNGYVVGISHRVNFARVFEYGATSVGNPLLWIGISPGSHGVRARHYGGKLFRPGPRGHKRRVLVDTTTRQVMYVGIPRVNIRPRWNLRDVAYQQAEQFLESLKNA